MSDNPVLTRLREERERQTQFITELFAHVETESRDLVDAEKRNLEAAEQRIAEIDAQIEPIEAFESRAAAHRQSKNKFVPAGSGEDGTPERQGLGARTEPRGHEYRTAGEYLADRLKAAGNPQANIKPDQAAQARLAAYEARAIAHETTAQLTGLLPENIVGQVHNDIDAARPFLSSIGVKDGGAMPPGKTFRRPYVSQHTQVGAQAAEKGELPSRQLIIEDLEFDKITRGGALNVSRQAIDWTSPSAWDAIISDLNAAYAIDTEDWAAGQFNTLVTQEVELATDDVEGWISAIYAAAAKAISPTASVRASSLRLPNHIWTSVDMWGELGAMLAKWRAGGDGSGAGTANAGAFTGSLLDFTRTMVPGLPAGTVVVGRTNLVEAYEQRIGLLQAVEPKVLGIEIATGGYLAFGALDATGFVKIVDKV